MITHTKSLEDFINPAPDFRQLEKVLLRDGIPDYVPFYELFVNPEIMEIILGRKITDRASTIQFYYKAGYDYVPAWPTVNLQLGSLVDTSCEYPIKDWKSFDEYPWPDPVTIRYDEFEVIIPLLPKGMRIVAQNYGIFESVQMLLGYSNLCMMLYDNPELVEAVFERLGAIFVAMYKGMAAIKEVGAVVISDDMGFKSQTLLSANDMRKYVLPYHKKLTDIIHDEGKPCILHSCGNLSEIMEDIIEYVRIDAKHSYEDNILPVTEAKKLFGDRLAILGGIDLNRLCTSTQEEICSYSTMLIDKLGSKGGYALGSGNSIAPYVPVKNYLSMLEAGWESR